MSSKRKTERNERERKTEEQKVKQFEGKTKEIKNLLTANPERGKSKRKERV